jgi:hypothetical protein
MMSLDVLAQPPIEVLEDTRPKLFVQQVHARDHIIPDPSCCYGPRPITVSRRRSGDGAVIEYVERLRSVYDREAISAHEGVDIAGRKVSGRIPDE